MVDDSEVAFRRLWTVWLRQSKTSLQMRLRLYESFVALGLTYNLETRGITNVDLDLLDKYHRRHLRHFVTGHTAFPTVHYTAAVDAAQLAKSS